MLDEDYIILESTITFATPAAMNRRKRIALPDDIEDECVEAFMVLTDNNPFEADENITVMIINATAVRGSEMYNLNVSSSALEFTIVNQPSKH